jgi:hypothetical protein
MNKQTLGCTLLALWLFISAGVSPAKELLFQAEPANPNYARGLSKKLAEAHRTEFDPRMFPQQTWIQRLSYSSYKPDLDETLEIYSKPEGSRWLSHRRAKPSLTGLILRRVVHEENFDLKKQLDAVPITAHDVALPPPVADELKLLWQTMLPGVAKAPEPLTLSAHAPLFDAWVRKDRSVKAGRISGAAYDTPVYRAFVDVINDLREACDRHANSADPIFKGLPVKIRNLRTRL